MSVACQYCGNYGMEHSHGCPNRPATITTTSAGPIPNKAFVGVSRVVDGRDRAFSARRVAISSRAASRSSYFEGICDGLDEAEQLVTAALKEPGV